MAGDARSIRVCIAIKRREMQVVSVSGSILNIHVRVRSKLTYCKPTGMIIRCRTCPASYCYDCLDKEKDWVPVGDSIDEFEVLGFGANTQSYYIHCPECIKYHNEHPEEAKRWKTFFKSQRKILAKLKEADEEE